MKSNLNFTDNITLEFDANGVTVRVCLNVSPEIAKYVSPNNLVKGGTYNTYVLKMHVASKNITHKNLTLVKDTLLKTLMSNIRLLKSKYLKSESDRIFPKQLSLYENTEN